MKKIISLFLFFLFVFMAHESNSQFVLPHQSQSPPVNPYNPFIRGMYVDCADQIVSDIVNGNPLGLRQQLHNYIRDNYIGYIVLCGLEASNIFGNAVNENALRDLLSDTRRNFPGIQIGLSGSNAALFQNTPYLHVWEKFGRECYPTDLSKTKRDFEQIINDASSASLLKRSELIKFFFRAARFGNDLTIPAYNSPCPATFDVFHVQYRYWNQTTSMADMQNEFANFKTILTVLNTLKCRYNCLNRIDAEFLPTDLYKLQGWTAIDQIFDIDPLADRLVLPVFTFNAGSVFDQICKTMHYLTDPFSKPRSEIFIELSAESPLFNYCNSSQIPSDFLGNYLNGTTVPNGNLYSVESSFVSKYNNPSYVCSACNCNTFQDNHYTSTNIQGNIFAGIIWGPYSMMARNSLFRKSSTEETFSQNFPVDYKYYDLQGRLVARFNADVELNDLPLSAGIYIKRIIYDNGKMQSIKILIPNAK